MIINKWHLLNLHQGVFCDHLTPMDNAEITVANNVARKAIIFYCYKVKMVTIYFTDRSEKKVNCKAFHKVKPAEKKKTDQDVLSLLLSRYVSQSPTLLLQRFLVSSGIFALSCSHSHWKIISMILNNL